MRTSILLLTTLLAVNCLADTYDRQPFVDAVHYDISFELTDISNSIRGTAKIQVLIRGNGVTGMWLDMEDMWVDSLMVEESVRPFTYRNGRLAFNFEKIYAENETVLIEVRYHGKPQSGLLFGQNRFGRRVIFSDNWPDNAHHWFPSIDHPADKATVTFSVTTPNRYEVVSNGRMEKTVSLLDNRKLTRWAENKPIPTYCMVVGVAEFSITHESEKRIPLHWYSFPQDSETASRKFSKTDAVLAYFENLIGPYPYEKLAQVQSIIPIGAMENSSAIFYSERSVAESAQDTPVVHEVAHQWFGDSVTPADWDHLWLSEGFATYLDALFNEHLYGRQNLIQTMTTHARRIIDYRQARTEPVVNPAQTSLIGKLNPLSYEKGAWILHMLRGVVGDKSFFEGMRRFYKSYQSGNALSGDFQKEMETAAQISLESFFRQWLYQPGWPELSVVWRWKESTRELEFSVEQIQTTGLFDMPLELALSVEGRREIHRVRISKDCETIRIPVKSKPASFEIDPGNWVLDSATIAQDSNKPDRPLRPSDCSR